MEKFESYLSSVGEIGFVEEAVQSISYVSGLPEARPQEVVLFESGDVGQVFSLTDKYVEVLMLSRSSVNVGTRVVRTGELLKVGVGNGLLGRIIDPLGHAQDDAKPIKDVKMQLIDTEPPGIVVREHIKQSLETGVALVDLAVPLAKGQRELVIGDRKTGKTRFLLQTALTQAQKGAVCIYAAIGKRKFDTKKVAQFFAENNILQNTIIVTTNAADPAGLIFLTPYTAMTIAEHFRDQGMDALVILDDLTTHAKYYREISLLARRFPGRSAYPGDIFYVHAKLLERAGNYKKGSITCLPAAESMLGDLSGYIQTNIMAMTDGHIFFDVDLFDQGRRPAVNPFLSVTRVGHQAQTVLQRDVSRTLSSFLVHHEKMMQFMHFGAEVSEGVQKTLALGSQLVEFFNQSSSETVAMNVNTLLIAGLWAGLFGKAGGDNLKSMMEQIKLEYSTGENYKKQVDELIKSHSGFNELVAFLRREGEIITDHLPKKG